MGEAKQLVKNNFAEALGYVQQPGTGLYIPRGIGGPAVISTDTMVVSLRNNFISNNRVVLSQAYSEIGLIETIVDVPVDDAFRGGVDIKTAEIDESQVEELRLYMEEHQDLEIAAQTCKWDRLYGAAGTIILNEDEDPTQPFDVNNVQQSENVSFIAADLWELYSDRNLDDNQFNVKKYNVRRINQASDYFTYYGQRIHRSRVMLIKGKKAPSLVAQQLRGWGLSVVESTLRSINQYLKATDLGFEVLDEFKLDIFMISDLINTLMVPGGEEAIQKRIALLNAGKSYKTGMVMDKNDAYESKQLSFSGLAETMAGIRMQVASDVRFPLTKLFGTSSTGFSSGEDDIENYNSMIESTIRSRYKFHLLKMVKIRCMELFGMVPNDLSIHWKSLRVLKATDEQTVKSSKFSILLQARQANELTSKEFRDACNKGNLMDIRLETTPEMLAELEAERETAPQGEGEDGGEGEGEGDGSGERVLNSLEDLGFEKPISSKGKKRLRMILAKYYEPMKPVPKLKAYGAGDKLTRLVANSLDFDKASYEADGGDSWIHPSRAGFFSEVPVGGDEAKWRRAEQRSIDVFGMIKWQFVAWFYSKLGGKHT